MTSPMQIASSAMPPGTRLGEFEITGVVGEGGFGIVYSALDSSLDRVVAVKEYLPAAFAGRAVDGTVQVRSEDHKKTFAAGLASFINEARMLAKFSHPSLVEVFRFWEANGTAYMAMRYYRGITLREVLRTNPQVATEQWLCETLDPILLALSELHREECFHRDIAPDNILVLPNGRSVLMDFGAARRIIGGMTRALTTVLKPGYAPIEQYSDDGSMKQGAWTDIYAVGGLLYHAMTGKVPVQAISRMMNDPLKPVAALARAPYSENLCAVVMKCLAVAPEHRYQTIDELRGALGWVTTPISSTVMFERTALVRTVPVVVDDLATVVVPRSVPRTPAAAPVRAPVSAVVSLDPLAQIGGALAPAHLSSNLLGVGSDSVTVVASQSKALPTRKDAVSRAAPPTISASEPDSPTPQVKKSAAPKLILGGAAVAVVLGLGYAFLIKPKPRVEAVSPIAESRIEPKKDVTTLANPPTVLAVTPPAELPVVMAPPASGPPIPMTSNPDVTSSSTVSPNTGAQSVSPGISPTIGVAGDAKSDAPPVAILGTIPLDIKPWGTVVVNGVPRGASPPLKNLRLTPGVYTIEIQNPAGPAVTRTIDVVSGRNSTLRHSF
jgi:serine/threonine protein kinase